MRSTTIGKYIWRNGLLLLVVVSTMAGCTGIPTYVEPNVAPFAKVRVVLTNPGQFYMSAATFDASSCKASSIWGWVNGGGKPDARRIDMLDSKPPANGILERQVPAGRRIAIGPGMLFAHLSAGQIMFATSPFAQEGIRNAQASGCLIPEFTPEEGGEYEVVITPVPHSCGISLQKLTSGPNGEVQRTSLDTKDMAHVVWGGKELKCSNGS